MTIRLPPLVSKTVTLVRKPLEHCSDVITFNVLVNILASLRRNTRP